MKKKCLKCGKNTDGNDYCFQHKPRTQLKQRMINRSLVPKKGISERKVIQMKEFFMNCWKVKPHVSEISNKILFEPPSTAYFHHILSKSKYPEAMLDEENIILLTIDEHANVENDMFKYEEINKRREKLLKKYKYI